MKKVMEPITLSVLIWYSKVTLTQSVEEKQEHEADLVGIFYIFIFQSQSLHTCEAEENISLIILRWASWVATMQIKHNYRMDYLNNLKILIMRWNKQVSAWRI